MVTDAKLTARESWQEALAAASERDTSLTTISGDPIDPLYLPDEPSEAYERDIGYPGQYPFTRGIHANLYRGRLWTMRQFAGFGTPEETNARFRFLLEKGQTGLSTAFDLPTLMGLDSDHPTVARRGGAAGRGGRHARRHGTAVRRHQSGGRVGLDDDQRPGLYRAIVLSGHGARQGVDWKRLRGTLQNDILKEYHAQNEFVFPPRESVRLVTDTIEFCAREVPQFNPVSISGYHIREAGSTAAEELAFTLADGFHYVEQAMERGLAVDDFAPRLSFFFNSHSDFFEEIAKFRAARRIWARHLRERYGAGAAQLDPAIPCADFRRQLAGAAAGSKRDPRRVSGDGRGLGGLPIAAHQQPRRNAVAADRRGRDDRAPRNKYWPSRPAS